MDVAAQTENEFAPPPSFHSIQALSRLDNAYPYWGGQFALLSLRIQMLISPRNALPDTPRNVAAIWASLIPVKLTYKINTKGNSQGVKTPSEDSGENAWVSLSC